MVRGSNREQSRMSKFLNPALARLRSKLYSIDVSDQNYCLTSQPKMLFQVSTQSRFTICFCFSQGGFSLLGSLTVESGNRLKYPFKL